MRGKSAGAPLRSSTPPTDCGRVGQILTVHPFPPGTESTPSSIPAPGRKKNCTSGCPFAEGLRQNAPPSTRFETTGPLLKKRYCKPAAACRYHLLYLS